MAKIVLIGLEQAIAAQIHRLPGVDGHQIEEEPQDVAMRALTDADIVFAGGEPARYMSLLKRVRHARPGLPFVVITPILKTMEWLDALEAGATDCCSTPIDTRQLHWLMESALPGPVFAAE